MASQRFLRAWQGSDPLSMQAKETGELTLNTRNLEEASGGLPYIPPNTGTHLAKQSGNVLEYVLP